jgi:hypothetical protein
MSKRLWTTAGLFVLCAVCALAQASADKRTIQVDIDYTGSRIVNASHKIYVALWDSSDTSGGPPVAVLSLNSKKGTVTFSDVQRVPAFVSAAQDPTGNWDAQSPPPSGSSPHRHRAATGGAVVGSPRKFDMSAPPATR